MIESIFIGVEIATKQNLLTYAVLDGEMQIRKLTSGKLEDLLAFISEDSPVVVAINSPSGLSHSLSKGKLKSEAPKQASGREMRLAERELRRRGILIPITPSTNAACLLWVQTGFELYRKLEKRGFAKYPQPEAQTQYLETNPQAVYYVLAESAPQPKLALEGRLQRQLLLYEHGLRIPDPMDFFEEITRHKMTKGNWPLDLLYAPEQLNALAAALTAWTALRKPERISLIGAEAEGQIVLPVNQLKEKY